MRSRPRRSGRQREELIAIVVCPLGNLLYRAPEGTSRCHVPSGAIKSLVNATSTCTTRSPQCCSTRTFEPSDAYIFHLRLILVRGTFAQVVCGPRGFEEARHQEDAMK